MVLRVASQSARSLDEVTKRCLVLRARAQGDVAEALAHDREFAGDDAAFRFGRALERALRHIAEHPFSGSTRYGDELDLPGLRSWPIKPYPHLLFYAVGDETTHVWRVLHGRRDIPARLREGFVAD